jgi:hypothetical protein
MSMPTASRRRSTASWAPTCALVIAGALAGCTVIPTPPPTADEQALLAKTYTRPEAQCERQAADHILALGITPAQVDNITIYEDDLRPFSSLRWLDPRNGRLRPSRSDLRDRWIVGHRAWVSLKDCKGDIVIRFTTQCTVQETYTHGDCALPSVEAD